MGSRSLLFSRGVTVGAVGGLVVLLGGLLVSPAWAESQAPARRTSAELVREALNCELAGMDQQRQRLLDRALQVAPDHPPARWQNGEVRVGNQWRSVTDALETENQKHVRESYEERRAKAPDTVDGQLALADWCAKHRLTPQETAHLNRVLQLAPDHLGARQRLQYERLGNKWVRRQDLWQGLRQPQQRAESLRKWHKRLDALLAGIRRNAPQALETMVRRWTEEATTDAVPALEIRLGNDSEAAALVAVEILGSVPSHEASAALARLAVLSPWATVREAAARELRSRPRDHYVPMLLAELSTPITSQVQSALVNGRLVYRHQFVRETQERREATVLDTVMDRRPTAGDTLGLAAAETRTRALTEAQATAYIREWERMRQNRMLEQMSDRICETLRTATGKDLLSDAQAWWSWWDDDNEVYLTGEKPYEVAYRQDVRTYTDTQRYQPGTGGGSGGGGPSPSRAECFVAGTLVWTIKGTAEIQSIRVGDLVLSQDPDTGELAHQPVLQTTQRAPEPLIRLRLATRVPETLEGSGGHPLWVAGEGWVNLRRLQSGMILHGVGGATVISDVEETGAQPTYNLVVDGFHTYVVGTGRLVCHDNTPRRPTNALVPGLTIR